MAEHGNDGDLRNQSEVRGRPLACSQDRRTRAGDAPRRGVIREHAEKNPEKLPEMEGGEDPAPAQLAFTVWRVNDDDLAVQDNEAVDLACKKLGVERRRTDPYFDGTFDRSPVKIVPLGHPLTPLDLEELRREHLGIPQPKIDDWRAMADCVMFDPAYDGEVFDIALSDVPERKSDLVTGKYTLPAPAGPLRSP